MTLLLLVSCETPVSVSPSPSASPTPTGHPSPTVTPTPGPYAYSLLYGESLGANQPTDVRVLSLNGGLPKRLAAVAAEHDGLFAVDPRAHSLAILDKLDHHVEHTTTWRLRLLDLASGGERDVVGSRTDAELDVPWNVGWTPTGTLLLASRRSLDAVDVATGARTTLLRFADGTLGVTFPDFEHPALVVSQTVDTYSLYDVDDAGARKITDRPLVGVTNYALRPDSGEVVELVTRFDGRVTLAVLRGSDATQWELKGPAVDGYVHLAGTTPKALYLVWPIAKDDPLAYGVEGSALLFAAGYDASLTLEAGARNWGEFGPLGVSPDGRALLVPTGERAATSASNVPFSIAVCCERRPPAPLLGYGDRFVIGWLPER